MTPMIDGPAADLIATRLTRLLDELASLMRETRLTHISLFASQNATVPISVYATQAEGARFGGYQCGAEGILQPDEAALPRP